ncbi:MAG: OmpA family protein [Phycisphaerales bacterium]|nr:MAG: OmpA family protein [Phycisphaerales bacterium]
MSKHSILRVTTVLGVILLVSGCTNGMRERITILEEANSNLTEQLNYNRSELDDAYAQRDELSNQVAQANREAEALRAQLESQPEPQVQAPGWTAVPGGAMIAIEGSVLFAPGRAVLRKESRKTLAEIISAVQGEYTGKDVLVFGHTDNQPIRKSGWTDNWQLSTERSLAVVRYLQSQGISPERLAACGCGEYRPLVDNSSQANQARNRRVEIFAIDPQ